MVRMFSKITSLCFAFALMTVSLVVVSAADATAPTGTAGSGGALTLNGEASVNEGDVVTYTLYLDEASDPVMGFEFRIFYDTEFLEYQKGSLRFEKFDVVIYNENVPGRIPMNCSQLNKLPDFSQKAQFVSADFKVLKGGASDITYFFTDLYGEDLEYLKNYKFTYDLTRGSEVIVSDKIPIVNTSQDVFDQYSGDFINHNDGMGDNYVDKSDSAHEELVEQNGTLVPYIREEYVVKDSGNDGKKSGDTPWFLIIGGIVFGAAVIGAVVFLVFKSKKEEN